MRIISLIWLFAITTGLIAIDIHLGAIEKLDTEISNSLALVNATIGADSGD